MFVCIAEQNLSGGKNIIRVEFHQSLLFQEGGGHSACLSILRRYFFVLIEILANILPHVLYASIRVRKSGSYPPRHSSPCRWLTIWLAENFALLKIYSQNNICEIKVAHYVF